MQKGSAGRIRQPWVRFRKQEWPHWSLRKRGTAIEIYDAGLNMTAAPGMLDLARRLVSYEAGKGKASEPMESPTLRVYEKLRATLGEFIGAAAFRTLASRALALARPETSSLNSTRITDDGPLQGEGEIENQFEIDDDDAVGGGVILIARLLGLLRISIGESVTLSLLRNAWPGEILNDLNNVLGRKHE